MFGCLLAGFYLLRVYDMPIATFVAVALNVVVAAGALALARAEPRAAPAHPPFRTPLLPPPALAAAQGVARLPGDRSVGDDGARAPR